MNWKQFKLILVLVLVVSSFPRISFAAQTKIQGDYCYQYGDSESLMAAKEISYAMALRKAIETYKTFATSTSVVKDFQLRKDLVETIASGYVENIQIIEQEVRGRNVCTELVGYVNPDAVKNIIARKVEKTQKARKKEFKGLLSNFEIKILNYKKQWCYDPISMKKTRPCAVEVLYEAKRALEANSNRLIIDCFDKSGNPMEGVSVLVPADPLREGEVRKQEIHLPDSTFSFNLRIVYN